MNDPVDPAVLKLLAEREEQLRAIPAKWASPPENLVGKLPRITCRDCRESRSKVCDRHQKSECSLCKQWITSAHIHIDYFGHAETTTALLEIDPHWTWEPAAWGDDGLPRFVVNQRGMAEMYGRLTVLGVTRPEVGSCQASKDDCQKELVGDFLRRAAMRFGVAVNLWSKADHEDVDDEPSFAQGQAQNAAVMQQPPPDTSARDAIRRRFEELPTEIQGKFLRNMIEAGSGSSSISELSPKWDEWLADQMTKAEAAAAKARLQEAARGGPGPGDEEPF